jgi:imidazolonepropionase-like amidohydrolase
MSTFLRSRGCAAALCLPLALASNLTAQATAAQAPAGAPDLLVRAATVWVAPGQALSPGEFLVRGGRIAYVGSDVPAEARERARVLDYGPATICPGFVLAVATLGQDRDLAESAVPFTPDLRAADAFDAWQDELAELPRAGITAAALSPAPRNVAAGLQALVQPAAPPAGSSRSGSSNSSRGFGTLVANELQPVFSLVEAARNPEREPTSLMGQKELLRAAFTAAQRGTSVGPDTAVLRQVLQGGRRAFVHADSFAELCAALDLARDFGFEPVLVGARDAGKLVDRLLAQRARLVLSVPGPDARRDERTLPAVLAKAGVPFAFTGRPESLRAAAALAIRQGLDRSTALAALTRLPAQLLEQDQRLGSLRQGSAADFLVFHGEPLDLDSRHLATFVAGRCLFGAEPQASPKTRP